MTSPQFVEVVVGGEQNSTDLVATSEPFQINMEGVLVEVPPGFDRATLELLRGSAY